MKRITKLTSSELVAKTNITENKIILLHEISEGIERHIIITGVDTNTVIREYTKDNDLYQTAVFISGSKGNDADWNDNSGDVIYTLAYQTNYLWKKIDLGEVKNVFLRVKIGASNLGNEIISVYISNDDVTYTQILSAQGANNATSTFSSSITEDIYEFRYLKVEYTSDTTGGTPPIQIYTIEIFETNDDNCKGYMHLNDNKVIDYIIKTDKDLYTVIIFTKNCNYRIVDIDEIETEYILVESD